MRKFRNHLKQFCSHSALAAWLQFAMAKDLEVHLLLDAPLPHHRKI